MDLIKCPVCGEMYSSSYPHCPFCEEDGDSGRKVKYKPKRRIANRQKALSARGGMVVVLVLVLALLSWYLFGDNIIHRGEQPTPEQEDPHSGTEQAVPAGPSKLTDDPEPSGGGENVTDPVQTTDPVTVTDPEPVTPPVDTNVDVSGAKLNRDDFTLSYAGEKFTIKLSGTTATPTWSIDNANVASIGTDGTVTAIANGDTTVHCKVGSRDLTCTVRVRGTGKSASAAGAPTVAEPVTPVAPANPGTTTTTPATSTAPETPTTSGGSAAAGNSNTHVDASSLGVKTNYGTQLQKDPGSGYPDCTVRIGGDPITLIVTGTSVPVSGWSSDKTSVVTVDDNGRLTPVSAGTAHVTATVGDAKITCIIRVR